MEHFARLEHFPSQMESEITESGGGAAVSALSSALRLSQARRENESNRCIRCKNFAVA
jgi:hypothetical protein